MSILDDAIRQHLELKRAHGADDSELKRLEDEAFGPPQRPDEIDPFAEAPTEFLVSPSETPAVAPAVEDDATRSGRRPDIADLQEGPPPAVEDAPAAAPPAPPEEELAPLPDAPPPSPADAADAPPPPPADELPAPDAADEPPAPSPAGEAEAAPSPSDAALFPTDEEQPAGGGEIADAGPNTEERHAIADQPTQMFDVQAHVDSETEAPPEENVAPPPSAPEESGEPEQEPLDTRGPDAEVAGHPPAESTTAEEESAEFDFFNEQRLSDELDQALEAPLPPTDEHIAMPRYEDAPPAQTGIFDFETEDRYEEDPSEEALRRHDTPEPPSEESPRDLFDPPSEELEPPSEEYDPPSREHEPPSEESPRAAADPPSEEADNYDPDTGHEDVLEDTPTFLENAPEDDDLWFEQKPPKDFDL